MTEVPSRDWEERGGAYIIYYSILSVLNEAGVANFYRSCNKSVPLFRPKIRAGEYSRPGHRLSQRIHTPMAPPDGTAASRTSAHAGVPPGR